PGLHHHRRWPGGEPAGYPRRALRSVRARGSPRHCPLAVCPATGERSAGGPQSHQDPLLSSGRKVALPAVRHCRNVLLGSALLLAPAQGLAQQAISPVVFPALNSAWQAQEKGDLAQARRLLDSALEQASAGSLKLALIQQRLGY